MPNHGDAHVRSRLLSREHLLDFGVDQILNPYSGIGYSNHVAPDMLVEMDLALDRLNASA
jgi:hypothetical protein